MKKSEFSGMFGDYSSFSDEMDHISDPTFDPDEDEEEEEETSEENEE
jgi:spermidine/putrescine transport system ATP-binding protein